MSYANDSQVKHSEKAREVFAKNTTPRWRALDTLEAYVDGRQYDGRPDWFNDEIPLLKRKPCVIEPIVESAIESYQDLIFGESRFPKITSGVQEDDRAFDQRFGLGPEDSATLDHLIQAVLKQANVPEISREALARAMGSRTAVGICGVRDGRLVVDLEPAKCCTPTFDPNRPDEIVELEIKYPYIELYWDSSERSWAEKCMLYRRVIDAQQDVTYYPVRAPEDGAPFAKTVWREHIAVPHRLGFCPVVWYPYRKINSKRNDVDGIAIHERLLDEIDAFNRTLSQRHRAGIYCGDPQIIEIGVGADEDIGPSGNTSTAMNTYVDESGRVLPNQAGAFSMYTPGTASTGARKKGPNVTWRYSNPNTKVEFLQLHDTALRPLDEEADRLRSLLAEGMSWVRPLEASSSNSKINVSRLSGKTLRLLYKRQTSQCDTIRPDTWNGWLYPLVSLLLRIVYEYAKDSSRGALYLGGIEKAQALLERFNVEIAGAGGVGVTRWFNPALSPIWGTYFEPDEQDQLLTSQQLKQDHESGFITLRTAVQKQASFYAIDNVDAYLKELEKETADRKQEEMDRTVEEATRIHEATAEPEGPPFGGGK